MAVLWVTRGLPGSGKTSWALRQIDKISPSEEIVRVNRDDLREMLFTSVDYTPCQEKVVTTSQRSQVTELLRQGISVIVDDTNLPWERIKSWRSLARRVHAGIIVVDFPADVDTCRANIAARVSEGGRDVPEKVVRDMAKRWPPSKWKQLDSESNERPWAGFKHPRITSGDRTIICDLDGTLAKNVTGRSWFDEGAVGQDEMVLDVANILECVSDIWGCRILFFTGRSEACRDVTEKWLEENFAPYLAYPAEYSLHMRTEGDRRGDAVVKWEMYQDHAMETEVLAVFDDRLSVCRMWHEIGLPLFRLGDPDADF